MARSSSKMTAEIIPPNESVMIGGKMAALRWRRSSRARRIALKIDPRVGAIVITLPPRGSRRSGLALLHSHEAWVVAHLDALPGALVISAGNNIPVFGKPHLILHDPSHRGSTLIADSKIVVSGESEFIGRRVRDALRLLAADEFASKAKSKATAISTKPLLVKVKDTTSRWGSCTANGVLMFSWRLIMAPEFVQDYVISHEVAHLRYMNHAESFWQLTDSLTPYRSAASTWLKENGPKLLRLC